MAVHHTRLAWTILLVTATALLFAGSARAQLGCYGRSGAGSDTILWTSRASEVLDALSAYERGALDKTVWSAKRALRRPLSRPDRLTALYLACAAESRLGHSKSALRFCNKAAALARDRDWRHLSNRGDALLRAGQVAEAIVDYEDALAILSRLDASSQAGSASSPGSRSAIREGLGTRLTLALRQQEDERAGNETHVAARSDDRR